VGAPTHQYSSYYGMQSRKLHRRIPNVVEGDIRPGLRPPVVHSWKERSENIAALEKGGSSQCGPKKKLGMTHLGVEEIEREEHNLSEPYFGGIPNRI